MARSFKNQRSKNRSFKKRNTVRRRKNSRKQTLRNKRNKRKNRNYKKSQRKSRQMGGMPLYTDYNDTPFLPGKPWYSPLRGTAMDLRGFPEIQVEWSKHDKKNCCYYIKYPLYKDNMKTIIIGGRKKYTDFLECRNYLIKTAREFRPGLPSSIYMTLENVHFPPKHRIPTQQKRMDRAVKLGKWINGVYSVLAYIVGKKGITS